MYVCMLSMCVYVCMQAVCVTKQMCLYTDNMFVFLCKQTMCVFACVNAESVCVCVCVFRMFRMFVCISMCLQTGSHYGALVGFQIEMLLVFTTVFNLNHIFLVLYYQFLFSQENYSQ